MQGVFLLLLLVGIAIPELRQRLKPNSPLQLRGLNWKVNEDSSSSSKEIEGWIEIYNPHSKMEVMIPELKVRPVLLGKGNLNQIKIDTIITPMHPDENSRDDNYWAAYIVKSKKRTLVKVNLNISKDPKEKEIVAENIWIEVDWVNYGPFGRILLKEGFIVPLKKTYPTLSENLDFKELNDCKVLALKTHILGPLDNPLEIFRDYASSIIQPGDVLTIGETPLAVMQGRYIHPSNIAPDWLALILCRAFHPTSSLATACGLQTLIDLVGPTRVLLAWIGGVSMKLLGIKGVFYRLAGNQARLIDDITGTTPPYDQTIVLGPSCTHKICNEAALALGIAVAVVDVNDLGRVKVVASSLDCNDSLVRKALRSNPAGNANERTPLVLIRPK